MKRESSAHGERSRSRNNTNRLKASGSRFMLLSKRTAFSPSVFREEESDKTRRDEHPLSAQRKLSARQVNSHLSSVFLSPHIDLTVCDDRKTTKHFDIRLHSSSKFLDWVLLARRHFTHFWKTTKSQNLLALWKIKKKKFLNFKIIKYGIRCSRTSIYGTEF